MEPSLPLFPSSCTRTDAILLPDTSSFCHFSTQLPGVNSFSHAIGFCFDERSAALLSSRMRSLIGPRPSDYPHALSACYYFLQAVFLLALGLWSSLPARQLSLDTSYSFLTFSVFFFVFFFFLSTERIDESYIKAPTATSNCRLTTSEDAWAFFGR